MGYHSTRLIEITTKTNEYLEEVESLLDELTGPDMTALIGMCSPVSDVHDILGHFYNRANYLKGKA